MVTSNRDGLPAFQAELLHQLRILLVNTNISLPRYQRLYEALRQQILEGVLLQDTRLPSSRVLAQQLKISRNTALAAIEQLCAEGYAAARPASGIYILPTAPTNWEKCNASAISLMSLNLSLRGKRISQQAEIFSVQGAFAPGMPDVKQFPYKLWQRYIARHAGNPKLDWLGYPSHGGHAELRASIAAYLRIARGIQCDAAQVLITNSTHQSLQLVAYLLAESGERVWLENPGYTGARGIFDAAGLKIISQPVDYEGLAPAADQWQHPPRLIYTTPSHQYPTGVVMSAARRRSLLASAALYKTWILEDDYDSEFRYSGPPLSALHALSPNQVIYFGTFSKILFPALRIAYLVLPENLVDDFRRTQARHHREPSYMKQNALADFMRDGHMGGHISKMRREYHIRRDLLITLLRNNLGDVVELSGVDTGLHLVIYLPPHVNERVLESKLYERGIVARALGRYYDSAASMLQQRAGLLIGFGNTDQADIKRAGEVLTQTIQQMLL